MVSWYGAALLVQKHHWKLQLPWPKVSVLVCLEHVKKNKRLAKISFGEFRDRESCEERGVASLFLRCVCGEPCLPLAPQLFTKGERFYLPLMFLPHLPKNKGLWETLTLSKSCQETVCFARGRQPQYTATFGVLPGPLILSFPLSPPRNLWHCRVALVRLLRLNGQRTAAMPTGTAAESGVHRRKGWKEEPAASRPGPGPARGEAEPPRPPRRLI